MSISNSVRSVLDAGAINELGEACQRAKLGEILTLAIAALTPTESGVVVTANVAPLANQPVALLQVNATAAGTTGIKTLKVGLITGTGAIVPATGECVWDGDKKVLFNATDAVTAAAFTYSVAGSKASCLEAAFVK